MPMQNEIFIKCLNSSSNRSLFIFPHAGANPASYGAALKKSNLDMNVYVLSLPGRLFQEKKNVFISFSFVFEKLLFFFKKIKDQQVYLLGHSMGCLFTYELAKHFQKNDSSSLAAFGLSAIKVPDHRFRSQKISQYDDFKFITHVEKYHFIPEGVKANPVFYSDLLETLKNDFKIIDSYQQPLSFLNNSAKAFIFGFENDPISPPDDLLKWTEYFSKYEGPIILPGDHFHFLESLPLIFDKFIES
jgi:medium-chain acyl-[acyl-carrier-protein] hydrolase